MERRIYKYMGNRENDGNYSRHQAVSSVYSTHIHTNQKHSSELIITMAEFEIPTEQWAQVIEQTGGKLHIELFTHVSHSQLLQSQPTSRSPSGNPAPTKSSSTSNTPASATPTCTPSTATGRSSERRPSSAATKAPASSSPRETT